MSFGAAVLTFREGLEAALIVAIMLGYLRKVGRLDMRMPVWAGALSAALLAIGFTLTLQILGQDFEYPAKGIYEGVTSLVAVVILTYMSLWMARQARYIKGSLEHSMKERLVQSAGWGLFGLAFMTVAREGVETALFLSASAFQTSGAAILISGLAGLAVALGVAWAVYVAGVRLQLRTFFKVAAVLLVIFGAAILRYAVHEFEEVGWLPPLIDQVWNTGGIVATSSPLGSVLQALLGYTSQPSLLQVIAYFGYLGIVGYFLLRPAKQTAISTQPIVAPVVPAPTTDDVKERQGEPVTARR